MTTLGSIALSDNLVLSGIETAPDLAVNQRRTLTGESVVQTAPVSGGRTLTLQGDNHFTLADIQAVKAMARLGLPVTLTHDRGTFTALVISISVELATQIANPDSDAWYSGEITLLEV